MLKKLARKTVDKNQSTFSFKEGFHELPYLANSPEAIVRSIDQMPFVTHDLKGQCISPKTKYMKGMMHYQKIEDGFWMIHGDLDYKANILYRSVDDKSLASDYYFLSFKLFAQHQKKKLGLINGSAYTNRSWLLFKPKANAADCHFAGSKELTFSMFFNKKWLKENLSRKNYFRQSSLAEFFKSDSRYIIWPDLDETNDDLCIQLCQVFQKKGRKGKSFRSSAN